jgi:N utilization substance protein B
MKTGRKPAGEKTARRQAREVALQALYAWQLSGEDPLEQAKGLEGFDRDADFVSAVVRGVSDRAAELQSMIAPHLTRTFEKLSPVERAILYIGAFELSTHPETPFKVVLNEAIELGKSFGGNEGHRFVNGVLEKVAADLRPGEFSARAKPA